MKKSLKMYNKLMGKTDFKLEKKLFWEGYKAVIGIDEAGRGPLAGPVVAAAVAIKKIPNSSDKSWKLVRDSKKLSGKQREKIFDFITENFHIGVGICDHRTIDRINILEASFLAMKKALNSMARGISKKHKIILIDGNKKIPNLSEDQMAVVRGDEIIKSISAASIIAKVTRDKIMLDMHKKYPKYEFDRHKGYGTRLHMEKLNKYGPSKIHRQSFKPVKSLAKRGNK